ncbi:S1 domain-containing protein [Arthrobacter burdickii]|uniref:S1 motif domain-containing protein n=1 Tax=Arthrobacter burdickii TaxID=3035920 RepID=A0ABT8K4G3_9MICC|nr:hypothetical protein [Arthrobacter burdickii]MDN4612355.1 hypothetical protein [Arthrobacter burdickii]
MPARKRHRVSGGAPAMTFPPPSTLGHPGTRLLTEASGVAELAELLLDPQRQRPVVVVSQWKFTGEDAVDVQDLAAKLGDDADLWIVPSGPVTMALADLLPPKTGIFNDALRVYPAHLKWLNNPYQSPLHILARPADVRPAVTRVLEQVEDLASARHWAQSRQEALDATTTTVRTGTVQTFVAEGSRAVVELDGGGQAMVRQEELVPEVPVSWLLSPGQRVIGVVDPAVNQMRCELLEVPSLAAYYPEGSLALGLVTSLNTTGAEVMLYPGMTFFLTATDVSTNEMDTVDDLLSPGEVVVVRIGRDAGRVQLTMLDIDDDEPVVPAPVLVAEGTPWLEFGRNLNPAPDEPAHAPDLGGSTELIPANSKVRRGTALRDTQLALESARAEIMTLREERLRLSSNTPDSTAIRTQAAVDGEALARLGTELGRVERRNQQLTERVSHLNEQLARLRGKRRPTRAEGSRQSASPAFLTAEEQVEHDLYVAWVERVPAMEKEAHPLGEHRFGSEFAASLSVLPADKKQKALKAVVDLLSALPGTLRARDAHILRTSSAGDAPAVTRAGGSEICWRLSIELGVEAARRLHYWKCSDGVIELSRVVVHEDFKP